VEAAVTAIVCRPNPIIHRQNRIHDSAKAEPLAGDGVPRVQSHTGRRCFPRRIIVGGDRGPCDKIGERAATLVVEARVTWYVDATLSAPLRTRGHRRCRSPRLVKGADSVFSTRALQLFLFVRGDGVPIGIKTSYETGLEMSSV
jgi:hypothetical protein